MWIDALNLMEAVTEQITKLFRKTRILPVNGQQYPDSLDFWNVQIRKSAFYDIGQKLVDFRQNPFFSKNIKIYLSREGIYPKSRFWGQNKVLKSQNRKRVYFFTPGKHSRG